MKTISVTLPERHIAGAVQCTRAGKAVAMADQDQNPQNHIDRFNEVSLAAAQQRMRDDALDQGLELAGLNGSRRSRFGVSDSGNSTNGKEKSDRERIRRTLEWLLLNDSDYARLHRDAITAVQRAAETARDVLRQIETELAAIHGILADIMESAAQLPDGTKVFRDENGLVRYANGDIVHDELAEMIAWRGDEPTYEYARRIFDREAALDDALHDGRVIEVEIGGYRDELTNNEDPPSKERIPVILDRIDSIVDRTANILPHKDQVQASGEQVEFQQELTDDISVPIVKIGN
ncbi:MAG: hypothetical protein AAGF25_14200 [Pseudomonadota bacterium]